MAESSSDYNTIIGPDAHFKGDLTFDSGAKLLGKFEGSITSKGNVHVADGARCKAHVKAKVVAVEGHIEGNVEATERVELKPKGMIQGDVVAATMTMADGASIDGHCRIGANSQASSGRPSSATETKPTPASQPDPVAAGKGR